MAAESNGTPSPNSVVVDEAGCSCRTGPYYGFQRNPIDPACPKHGEPLHPGDGAVDVHHPDGTVTVIPEPVEFPASFLDAVAWVTPCACSAQRERADAAEAKVARVEAERKAILGQVAHAANILRLSGNALSASTLEAQVLRWPSFVDAALTDLSP